MLSFALREFHVKEGQNVRDQITSARMISLCSMRSIHSFEVQTNAGYILVIKDYCVRATSIKDRRWASVEGQNAFAQTLCFA